jgi:hypothetical protein
MSKESAIAFEERLRQLLDHFRDEYDLTIVEAIGVMEGEKYGLLKALLETGDNE